MRTAGSIAEAPRDAKGRSFADSALTVVPIASDLRLGARHFARFRQSLSARPIP